MPNVSVPGLRPNQTRHYRVSTITLEGVGQMSAPFSGATATVVFEDLGVLEDGGGVTTEYEGVSGRRYLFFDLVRASIVSIRVRHSGDRFSIKLVRCVDETNSAVPASRLDKFSLEYVLFLDEGTYYFEAYTGVDPTHPATSQDFDVLIERNPRSFGIPVPGVRRTFVGELDNDSRAYVFIVNETSYVQIDLGGMIGRALFTSFRIDIRVANVHTQVLLGSFHTSQGRPVFFAANAPPGTYYILVKATGTEDVETGFRITLERNPGSLGILPQGETSSPGSIDHDIRECTFVIGTQSRMIFEAYALSSNIPNTLFEQGVFSLAVSDRSTMAELLQTEEGGGRPLLVAALMDPGTYSVLVGSNLANVHIETNYILSISRDQNVLGELGDDVRMSADARIGYRDAAYFFDVEGASEVILTARRTGPAGGGAQYRMINAVSQEVHLNHGFTDVTVAVGALPAGNHYAKMETGSLESTNLEATIERMVNGNPLTGIFFVWRDEGLTQHLKYHTFFAMAGQSLSATISRHEIGPDFRPVSTGVGSVDIQPGLIFGFVGPGLSLISRTMLQRFGTGDIPAQVQTVTRTAVQTGYHAFIVRTNLQGIKPVVGASFELSVS